MMTGLLVAAYLVVIVLANVTIATFGPGLAPVVGFICIGVDMFMRDYLNEYWRGRNLLPKMFGLIVAGAGVSYWLDRNSGMVALASMSAFGLSALVDWFFYEVLRQRPRVWRMNLSNIVSAAVDSVVFLTMIGVTDPQLISIQWMTKTLGGAMWSYLWLATVKRRNA